MAYANFILSFEVNERFNKINLKNIHGKNIVYQFILFVGKGC